MKYYTIVIFLLITNLVEVNAQGYAGYLKKQETNSIKLQESELKNQLIKHDFSKLFTKTDNSEVYGFIGENYQRIRIKFISVRKDTLSPNTYIVYGKSMVKNNIDEFNGTITISKILKLRSIALGVDNQHKNSGIKGEFIILGNYSLSENKSQKHSGKFTGTFRSDFYLDKLNDVKYDDIDLVADGYINNQFTGKWTDYKTQMTKTCNWGDYRIPNSGDLDIGAGEFSPGNKYLPFGWQTVRDMSHANTKGNSTNKAKFAKQVEDAVWWK